MMGFIYFIQAENGGPIKIGKANNPQHRLRDLQVGNPYPLVIRFQQEMVDALTAESNLHELFAKYRLCGEWFAAVPALAKIARAIPDVGDEEDIAYGVYKLGIRPSPKFIVTVDELTPVAAPPPPRDRITEHAEERRRRAADLSEADRWLHRQLPITAIPEDFDPDEADPYPSQWDAA